MWEGQEKIVLIQYDNMMTIKNGTSHDVPFCWRLRVGEKLALERICGKNVCCPFDISFFSTHQHNKTKF